MSAASDKSHHISNNHRQRDQGSQPPPSPVNHSHNRSQRKRKRQRLAPKPKKRKLTHATSKPRGENREEYNDWFAIRGIIDEKVDHSTIHYLVDWEGTDNNGRPHIPSWEPEENVTIVAIRAWEESRTGAKHKQHTSDVAVSKSKLAISTQTPNTDQREPSHIASPSDCKNLVGERPVLYQIQESETDEEAAHNHQLTEVKPTLSKATDHGVGVQVPSEVPGRRNNTDLDKDISRGIQEPQGAQKVIKLARDSLFDPNQYRTLSSSQGTSGQQQGHKPETTRDVNQVIPDSQAFSGVSITETQNSVVNPLDSFGTNQAQEEAFIPSRQSSENHQLKSHSHSTEIPSHQVDHRFPGVREILSGSALVNESSLGLSTSNNSQGTTSRSHLGFSVRENLSLGSVSTTGQSDNCASIHRREPPSDEQISGTSVSQDQIFTHSFDTTSQQSNSQAAQIVVPLSFSEQGGLVTRSHSFFTIYDDDTVIPETVLRNSQVQQDSQNFSPALDILDDSSKNTPSFKGHQSRSQSVSNHIESSQSNLNKPKNSTGEEESSIGKPSTANPGHSSSSYRSPRQQAAPTNMDSSEGPGAQMSARERLRLIREKSFASLQKPSTALTTNSEDPIQVEPKIDTLEVPQSAIPDPQAIEVPPRPDISPLTPPPLISTFPTQPPKAAQNDLSSLNMQQPSVPETSQAPVEPEKQGELILEEAGPVEIGFSNNEEQLGTLDPSNLTISIENELEIHQLLTTDYPEYPEFGLGDEDETPPTNYPKSLHPYVPTGHNEFLITLPFYSNCRPVYNDVLRENEELIREYNASFLVLPHLKPHPTIVSKVDEMFSRLFDVCDLPPFMETVSSMSPDEMTKHVVGTNAKFAFIEELLTCLADVKSDKKILILCRPGKAMDLLDIVMRTRGYHYIRSGVEIVGLSTAQHSLTVAISSTLDKSSVLEDADAIIAFDHTYQPGLLPPSLRERSPVLMVLANACSIQHLNMRVSDTIEPLERKNVLLLALVKAMRYIEDVGSSQITSLDGAAELFSDYIQDQDNDDFYWEPLEVPENVFEDLHASSQLQGSIPQTDIPGLEADQASGSRKRSHDADEDDEISSKRPRVSQPTVVTNVRHISDTLKGLLRDDAVDSPKAMLSVSVGKLETLSAKIATLKARLKESKQREQQFRELSDQSKKEVDGYTSDINNIQSNYMNALKDRGIFEDDYRKAKEEMRIINASLESSRKEAAELKDRNAELQKQLASANESLLNSANPELAKMAQLEKSLEEAKAEIQKIEKRAALAKNDMEYAKTAYQNASQKAGELGAENRALELEIELLRRKADDNIVKVNQINNARQLEELVRLLNEQKLIVHDRDAELGKVKEELRQLKENRRGTRQNSVPRSPRLSAFNSPRNGGARVKGGSSSRGTSPAPPPTGVFEAGGGGTPVAGRASHLRETRF
ncbi:hypothetical protein F4805DRAFT_446413 [Annulohypoxylon moriforme]|nr:hypothetical protein F4805DRAFT_446413 [Annulohypoxylon moriforme]